jgi:uncharacterized SAM-dependent methyltransferase
VPLLDALEGQAKDITYYGLDLSERSLVNGMEHLKQRYTAVKSFGLWGTFEDGLEWSDTIQGPRIFLSLGSIFGNDRFDRAVKWLKPWAAALKDEDILLIGIDGCQDPTTVWNSYHDEEGLFEHFVRNAFEASNVVLGFDWYRHDDWTLVGLLHGPPLAHRFLLRAKQDVDCADNGLSFLKGAEIECYEGFKYGSSVMSEQLEEAGLVQIQSWRSSSGRIGKAMEMFKLCC